MGYRKFVGFEVLIAMVMNSPVFRDITPYNPLKFDRRFGGSCRRHPQDLIIRQARNQHEAGNKHIFSDITTCSQLKVNSRALLATCFILVLAWLILRP
jgi:hypothetical protein